MELRTARKLVLSDDGSQLAAAAQLPQLRLAVTPGTNPTQQGEYDYWDHVD